MTMQEAAALRLPNELGSDAARAVPLVVDLDGTLIGSDLLLESLLLLARQKPLRLLLVPLWLARGRAFLKRRLAEEASPAAETLPYRPALLAHLEAERAAGRTVVLATAADGRLAEAIADHLGLFDRVLASDGVVNLAGTAKADRLVAEFGREGFDYAGSGRADRPVWKAARRAILVRPTRSLSAAAIEVGKMDRVLDAERPGLALYLRALRPHQWLKNALVLVPLIAAQRLWEPDLLLQAGLAFLAFSLCASSAYLVNDLLDLPGDRHHPRKRNRPLASGAIPLQHALALIPLLLAGAAAIALLLPAPFRLALALYLALTLAYSLRLKEIVILDVLVLAGLYTLRVMAGAAAVAISPSPWLLAFCVFLFFSLAMVKRYAELMAMRALEGGRAHARAYLLEDSELLAALGGASGYLAVLVLAIYATSDLAHASSGQVLLWLIGALLLYWISYMWLMAHRARMHDDPLVFALRDRVSRILIGLMAAILLAATWPLSG
jgi:4-hydroxybenzoate polyprenyltransferase/phosphoserine phosphatase